MDTYETKVLVYTLTKCILQTVLSWWCILVINNRYELKQWANYQCTRARSELNITTYENITHHDSSELIMPHCDWLIMTYQDWLIMTDILNATYLPASLMTYNGTHISCIELAAHTSHLLPTLMLLKDLTHFYNIDEPLFSVATLSNW